MKRRQTSYAQASGVCTPSKEYTSNRCQLAALMVIIFRQFWVLDCVAVPRAAQDMAVAAIVCHLISPAID